MIGLVGFSTGRPAGDGDVDVVATGSPTRGLVYRYRTASGSNAAGLAGGGTFLLCTFWLAQALAGRPGRLAGRSSSGRSATSTTWFLAERPTATGDLLGISRRPSAIGLINAAWAIAQAEEAPRRGRTWRPGAGRRRLGDLDDAARRGAGLLSSRWPSSCAHDSADSTTAGGCSTRHVASRGLPDPGPRTAPGLAARIRIGAASNIAAAPTTGAAAGSS
jgi:hypothetical protein